MLQFVELEPYIYITFFQADEEKCLAKSKGRPHPNISLALIHKLRKFFRPHNYKFYDLVGEDFGWADD